MGVGNMQKKRKLSTVHSFVEKFISHEKRKEADFLIFSYSAGHNVRRCKRFIEELQLWPFISQTK